MDAPVTLGGTGTSSAVAKGVDPRTTTFPPSLVAVLLCVVGVGLVGCWGVGGWWLVVCLVVGLCWLGSSVPSFVEVWLVWGGQSDLKEVWLVGCFVSPSFLLCICMGYFWFDPCHGILYSIA